MSIFFTALAKEVAILIVIGIAALVIWRERSAPCNSCRYLRRKGGSGLWRYTCKPPGNLFEEHFDKCPRYCGDYEPRDEEPPQD